MNRPESAPYEWISAQGRKSLRIEGHTQQLIGRFLPVKDVLYVLPTVDMTTLSETFQQANANYRTNTLAPIIMTTDFLTPGDRVYAPPVITAFGKNIYELGGTILFAAAPAGVRERSYQTARDLLIRNVNCILPEAYQIPPVSETK